MDLKAFVRNLTDEQFNDGDKNRKMDEFIRSYEISLIKKHAKKKLNLKNGLGIQDDIEPEFTDGEAQTDDEDESKIMEHDLRILWGKVNESRVDQESRMTSLTAICRNIQSQMLRVEKFCGSYQLLWKIRNFSQVLQEAKQGKKLIVQSPVFDSHRNGYKLQINVCPNGEGKAQNVFMSLFFSIMKGSSDSILPWPFIYPITFTVLNKKLNKQQQRNTQTIENLIYVKTKSPSLNSELNDHSMTFYPLSNPGNEALLKRPVEEKNKSLGFTKFILLEDLLMGGFVEDDNIYIGVFVDIFSSIN